MDGEVRQIGPRQNWDAAKHEVDLNHQQQICHLFQTISWKSSGSMQNRLIREGIHARCTGWSVLPVANAKSVFESWIEKGETCVLLSWDTCLTKLKKVRHTSEQAVKGGRDTGNMAIKDIIIILKLANQFGWLPCTQFQQKNVAVMIQTP